MCIRDSWMAVLKLLFLRHKKHFYAEHYNRCHTLYQFLKALFHPVKLLDDLRYGLVLSKISRWWRPAIQVGPSCGSLELAEQIIEEGYVILPAEKYISVAKKVVSRHSVLRENYSPLGGVNSCI